ncbi:hypothetical protein CBR_g38285 [Chara braunii]|uniref:Uncharacterized protein n=1 Tax=Chara braunii TaxID=69332 RepID=A0A388LPZ7_CHABU|nr:hypothetical protein CBR_g38285 [Chara braunii]|eukprot:GBG84315.1 hypothetical protein CBR_g38285 [Chara braunii]
MDMEAAIMQDVVAAALLEEEETPLELVRMYKRQMEDMYAVLTQDCCNLPVDLLEEGEELFIEWEEELHENFPLQRLGSTESAQVIAELRDCTDMFGKVRGIFVQLREGLTRSDDWKGCHGGELEEGQAPCTTLQDCFQGADDACVSVTFAGKDGVLCRVELEEGRGPCGDLEDRRSEEDEDCFQRGGGTTAMANNNNSNNNNNNNNNNNYTGVDAARCGEDEDNKMDKNIDDDNNNNDNDNNNNGNYNGDTDNYNGDHGSQRGEDGENMIDNEIDNDNTNKNNSSDEYNGIFDNEAAKNDTHGVVSVNGGYFPHFLPAPLSSSFFGLIGWVRLGRMVGKGCEFEDYAGRLGWGWKREGVG